MLTIDQLEEKLGYSQSPFYVNTPPQLEVAHLFRAAIDNIGVKGIYTFQTSPHLQENLLSPRPAVYVACADNETQAREIHRSLWNLNYAPFVIIALPHQIRIYTGFNYSFQNQDESTEVGLLHLIDTLEKIDELTQFNAEAINTGSIWEKYAAEINPENRVDERLLANLDTLAKVLQDDGLSTQLAHALIGKYVYLRYLNDRKILDEVWLDRQGLTKEAIFSRQATIANLKSLVQALEYEINGKVFPLDFNEVTLEDKHVALVASIFRGDVVDKQSNIQLHLEFQAYDFRYIPIETLSAIYEQFIQTNRKKIGAIYTPEVLADYLLAEMQWAKPLETGMKVFDPACGSGIFLVLAYRRLIEQELALQHKTTLSPAELASILLVSIYGVEREQDACYITEFSLILTLLHYAEPSALKSLNFELPQLYGTRIFQSDFFNLESAFWQKGLTFDWIVGNPPWIPSNGKDEKFADVWIQANEKKCPVGGKSVAEAFSWLVTQLLNEMGVIGLVLPATSLFKVTSKKYRQYFFRQQTIRRITNFANLREILFDGRTTFPAMTIIYEQSNENRPKPDILHYGPFNVNQVSTLKKKPWVITINENEIKWLSPLEAEKGETSFWKVALWGSFLDKRLIQRINYFFRVTDKNGQAHPMTLRQLCKEKKWYFCRDIELRNWEVEKAKLLKKEYSIQEAEDELEQKLKKSPELHDEKIFQTDAARTALARFSLSEGVLKSISEKEAYIRKRGGESGLKVKSSPHIILSPAWMSYIIYSDENFLMASRHMGIAGLLPDKEYLKALSVYLNSNLCTYYLFFHAPEWGIYRTQANGASLEEVGAIPVPLFSKQQIETLANLQETLAQTERQDILDYISNKIPPRIAIEGEDKVVDFGVLQTGLSKKGREKFEFIVITQTNKKIPLSKEELKQLESFVDSDLCPKLQKWIDDTIYQIFNIPNDIQVGVEDFIKYRLPLDKSTVPPQVKTQPTMQELLAYATEMRDELDDFVMGEAYHRVSITHSKQLIVCEIEITQENGTIPIAEANIQTTNLTMSEFLLDLSEGLRQQVSQWVYVQRGLRLFDGPRIYLCKAPRIIEWTRSQAILDAGDIIGELLKGDWHDE